jgi:3-oxoacid CoA-transferase subunit A
MEKFYLSPEEAIADVFDGCTIMFGGFGVAGIPFTLIKELYKKGTKSITMISNSPGGRLSNLDLSILFEKKQVKKVIASHPIYAEKVNAFEQQYLKGEVELELVPQGTLAERIRAGGAGIPGFYTPTGVDMIVAEEKESRVFNNKKCLFELALQADFAFIKAYKGDMAGNLVYHMTARNFNPVMATAAKVTIAEVDEIVKVGDLDPENIVTPGIFVKRLVKGERYETRFK